MPSTTYGNMVQHYGRHAARAVGLEHYGPLVHRYGKVAVRAVGVQNLATLSRRDLDFDYDHEMEIPFEDNLQTILESIPSWGFVLMIATAILGMFVIASTRYTLQGVVGTLAMVESPQTTVLVREGKEKYSDKDGLAEDVVAEEILVLKQKPITSSIKATIHHLRSRAGFLSRWRGLSAIVAFGITYGTLKNMMIPLFEPIELHRDIVDIPLAPMFASIIARLLVARLGLTWTHIVISESSTRSWIQRIPSRKAWGKILAPTFYNACAWQFAFTLPLVLAKTMDWNVQTSSDEEVARCEVVKLLTIGAIVLITFVGICIPAEVALKRVQASLLPEEDNAIVPFDRSFGGLVDASGKLGYNAAWRSFDRSARLRILKLYAKFFFVEVAVHAFFALVIITEFIALVGMNEPEFKALPIASTGLESQW